MGSREDRVYAVLTSTSGSETVSYRPAAQEKGVQNGPEKEVTKVKEVADSHRTGQ